MLRDMGMTVVIGHRPETVEGADCVVATDPLYAGFPHFHFYANPDFAVRFYETCLKEKKNHD